jgi:hypothetical protein
MRESFRQDRCAWCNRIFHVCRRCDRGQIYCQRRCRRLGRQRSQSRARRRHQATPEGRRDHADRQRRYRERKKKNVTEQGSNAVDASGTITPAGSPPPKEGASESGAEDRDANNPKPNSPGPRPPAPGSGVRCCVCGRSSVYVRFGWLQHHSRRKSSAGGPSP